MRSRFLMLSVVAAAGLAVVPAAQAQRVIICRGCMRDLDAQDRADRARERAEERRAQAADRAADRAAERNADRLETRETAEARRRMDREFARDRLSRARETGAMRHELRDRIRADFRRDRYRW
jgi:hypothetical protein